MGAQTSVVETTAYRIVLIESLSRSVVAVGEVGQSGLPTVSVPSPTRHTEEIRKAVLMKWNLHILILEYLPSEEEFQCCAVAELLIPSDKSELALVSLQALKAEFGEQQWSLLQTIVSGETRSHFSKPGWIDKAISWLESETGKTISSKQQIEQYNAGGAFSLVRFQTQDDRYYWLKATGAPNVHELSVTTLLSKIAGEYLPSLISSRPAWNAWLMCGGPVQICKVPSVQADLFPLLEDAVTAMAKLQMRTRDRTTDLMEAGAFDQSMSVFLRDGRVLFDWLEEAMSLQTATHVPQLGRRGLNQLRTTFYEVCNRMEDLGLPPTIVHGDLNLGNILFGDDHCRFVDWCEAYVGCPLISLQHLLLHNKHQDETRRISNGALLKCKYRDVWQSVCESASIEGALSYMSFLGVVSALYGRGDWFHSPERYDPRRQAHVRSLTRHLDRAAHTPDLLEALCH